MQHQHPLRQETSRHLAAPAAIAASFNPTPCTKCAEEPQIVALYGSQSSAAVSDVIVTGRIGARSFASAASTPNCRRQVKSWLALRS